MARAPASSSVTRPATSPHCHTHAPRINRGIRVDGHDDGGDDAADDYDGGSNSRDYIDVYDDGVDDAENNDVASVSALRSWIAWKRD